MSVADANIFLPINFLASDDPDDVDGDFIAARKFATETMLRVSTEEKNIFCAMFIKLLSS